MLRVLFSVFLLLVPSFWAKLTAQPDGFYYNGQKVFLSGANIAWYSYGYDFGNNQYDSHGPQLESWLTEISNNGGNSVRKSALNKLNKYHWCLIFIGIRDKYPEGERASTCFL